VSTELLFIISLIMGVCVLGPCYVNTFFTLPLLLQVNPQIHATIQFSKHFVLDIHYFSGIRMFD